MWNIKLIYSKNKGFTLIEIILALAISSMIIIPMVAILQFTIKTCNIGDQKDELLLNGRYGIEYIKGEVRTADKIISSNKIEDLNTEYPTNIGFVIIIRDEKNHYKYITYYTKNFSLIRIACTDKIEIYPTQARFSGHNHISEFVENIDKSLFNSEQSLISIDIKLKHEDENLRLKSDIYIRCPIDY